eukprot:CAMPEP_0181381746 /NCGR_PEP_ID=MMETSP1106-20121128/20312_1 /TAXON_ID=81844 /ORGANISM="Mantoniella antarctica, Strain SL-175" /LENGTH=45 /DNA_ID= /DNA_START= /DNA_END= /DNA_ORIENTATION=
MCTARVGSTWARNPCVAAVSTPPAPAPGSLLRTANGAGPALAAAA